MSSLPGGAADKAGNRYEFRWTALRIADVLEGRASRIRLEPPGSGGVGVEFEVHELGRAWGEQVKGADAGGTWTLSRLAREGVLAGARAQLELGRHFRLVVSTAAPQLSDLSSRARKTEVFEEFAEVLTGPLASDLHNLAELWRVTTQDAWVLLKRVHVEHLTADAMRHLVTTRLKLFFADDADVVIAALRDFCEDHIHQSLTAPQIWTHLESEGFRRRLLVGDAGVVSDLRQTVERHRRRVRRAEPSIGLVSRGGTAQLLDRLQAADGPQVTVLDGRAGFGKSTVVAAVASALETAGWFVAVARMDAVAPATNSSDGLGSAIGLADSPTVLLAGVADGSPALFVIDQLDAVSTYSGRMADNFEAVDDVLDEIAGAPNVKVLLVVRTVDLEADPRLRRLIADSDRVERHTLDRLSLPDVRDYLSGRLPASIPESTLELLRTPLHLAVFDRLSAAGQALTYRTLQGLYAQYTGEVRRSVESRVGRLDWVGITSALIEYMNDNEVLTVPASVLDGAAAVEVGALESESVIVRDGGGIAFFHESYFDYLFARSFVGSGRDLHTFLAASGQLLFRRSQTRQVLEHLAATDRVRFRHVVAELLGSTTVRAHLKEVVVGVLAQLDPVGEDWAAIDDLAWSWTPVGRHLIALLSRPGWFDAADGLGRWEMWLADPARVDRAFHQLAFAARQRPGRVEELVHPYVGATEDWRLRLRFLVEWSLTPPLTDLAVELVVRGDLDDARGPIAVNSDFWSIVYGVAREDPAAAARLTGAHLQRGLERARQEGLTDPFSSGHLAEHSQSHGVIDEIAELAPAALVEHIMPFVVELAVAEQRERPGRLPAGRRWGYRYRGRAYSVDNAVFAGVEKALRKLATSDPDQCSLRLQTFCHAESDELRFLACRTFAARGSADEAVEWLLSDERNFALGWADGSHWASRELIKAWSSSCSKELFVLLEESILAYSPVWEVGRWPGHAQYELLSAMDRTRLSGMAYRRLGELKRRFPESPPSPPRPFTIGQVLSPIGAEPSTHMSDEDWLRALRKHSRPETDWSGPVPVGGSQELAQVLGERASADPERFARLALRFDEDIPAAAIDNIIRNIEGHSNIDLVTNVCQHAQRLYGPLVGRSICHAAQKMGAADGRVVALIERYAEDPDPNHEEARTDASTSEVGSGDDRLMAGLNSTRGQAALAAASVLFAADNHLGRLLPVVEELASDPVPAVRLCAANGVVALLRHVPEQALAIAERLFDAEIDVFDASTTERLLTLSVLREPERFSATLARALNGPDSVARRAGRVWAVTFLRDVVPSALPHNIRELSAPARRGAAEVFAQEPGVGLETLKVLFSDEDAEVRTPAASAMRSLVGVPSEQVDELIEAFIPALAFDEHFDDLIDGLETLTTTLPAAAITACEQAVDIAGNDLGDIRTARSAMAGGLLRVLLRLYRQGGPDLRARSLDVIDRLTELNAYGVAEALESER